MWHGFPLANRSSSARSLFSGASSRVVTRKLEFKTSIMAGACALRAAEAGQTQDAVRKQNVSHASTLCAFQPRWGSRLWGVLNSAAVHQSHWCACHASSRLIQLRRWWPHSRLACWIVTSSATGRLRTPEPGPAFFPLSGVLFQPIGCRYHLAWAACASGLRPIDEPRRHETITVNVVGHYADSSQVVRHA